MESSKNGRFLYENILQLIISRGFEFLKRQGIYRERFSGQVFSEADLLRISESFMIDQIEMNIQNLTEAFIVGKISLPQWQERMVYEIKSGYIVLGQLGRGGKKLMTFSDYGRIGARLRQEYRFLERFAQEIKSGTLTANQILARAKLYARGPQVAYWENRLSAMADAGYTLERRVLHPAEHCPDCIQYASRGWQTLGSLPAPGMGSRCLHNCKCTKEFRK